MRYRLFRSFGITVAGLLSLLCIPSLAMVPVLPAGNFTAQAWLLVESRSGAELAAQAPDLRLPPASLTKLMTAYVLFGDIRRGTLKLDEFIVVKASATKLPGARMFLRDGESVSVENLLKGMLVESGNDAAYSLADYAGPGLKQFVARMNEAADRLGLRDTHYTNPIGFQDSAHYSSARDLARLVIALRHDFPEHLHFFALRDFTWADIRQPNRNLLLRDQGVDGMKTGHTATAGYCMVASAEREGQHLIAVLLGAADERQRARETRALLHFGTQHFETRRLYSAQSPIREIPVRGGQRASVALGVPEDLFLTLPRGEFSKLTNRAQLPRELPAPVLSGQVAGTLDMVFEDRSLRSVPLVTLEANPTGGLLKRFAGVLHGWFESKAQDAP
ncbi:MAG: D-alanyl-D-alanine carboxypeptidase [Gammaproteobacteria bacterium]|nr:D-alanyl-D-alanine carboxypeptidase [Gammaproteobacteria bacterium]